MIVSGAEPFFYPGGKQGVLLVHGLTGSPAEMLLLGRYLHASGYSVIAVRLAGHATTPEDLACTSWHDWYASVCDGYYLLSGYCETVSVIGMSMGGVLALLLSADVAIKKTVCISTPIFISPRRGLDALPPRSACTDLYVAKRHHRFATAPEYCNISYAKMPLLSVHELLASITYLKERLADVDVPTFVIQSKRDHTVDEKSGQYIYEHIKNENKEILYLQNSSHLVVLDMEKELAFARIKEFLADT